MATILSLAFQFITYIILSSAVAAPVAGENHEFVRIVDRELLGPKNEKVSQFRFYWHDIVSGPNPTSMRVVEPSSNTSVTDFGFISMMDNPLTVGPELSSKMVGKAQGFYASASQEVLGFLMAMNLAFVEGKYNGSTLTVLGRNEIFTEMREMPVIGGSGLFRFARGYVQARTYSVDFKTKDATVMYDVYVLHY